MRQLAWICALAAACQPASRPRAIDPQAAAILDAWATAIGGVDRLEKLHIVHTTGTITTAGGATGAFESWQSDRGELRYVHDNHGLIETAVYDGRRGWSSDASGLVIELDGPALEQQRTEAALGSYALLVPGRVPGLIAKVAADTLAFTPDGSRFPVTITFDPATHLPRRYTRVVDDNDVTTELDDWREVDGVKLAFEARVTSDTVTQQHVLTVDHAPTTFGALVDRTDDIHFAGPQPVTIPIEVVGGSELQTFASVNGLPPRAFVIDSGAPTLIDPTRIPGLDLHPIDAGQVSGQHGLANVGLASGVTISFPDVAIGPHTLRVVSLASSWVSVDTTIAGILGAELFEHAVVEIDYAHRTMRLEDPATYHHPEGGTRLPFVFVERSPAIEATIELSNAATVTGLFLVDTGCECELLANQRFADDHRADGLIGSGGDREISVLTARGVRLGSEHVANPSIAISHDDGGVLDGRAVAGLIGGRILRRFRVTFDYKAKTIWLDPP